MQRLTEPSGTSSHEAYLAAVEELTLELQQAITALTTGALSDFETSVVRQQTVCARLAKLTPSKPGKVGIRAGVIPACSDPLLASRIQIAVSALSAANLRYSRLVKHFGETTRVFAGMFRPYGGPAKAGSYLQRSQSAWSCVL